MTEQLKYEVLKKFPNFEIRRYPDYLLVQVRSSGEFRKAGYLGFYPLLRYITGENQSSTKISMTAPVLQESTSANDHVISFVLPESVSLENVPVPKDSRVETKLIKSHDAAAIKFSGSWSKESMHRKGEVLLNSLKEEGINTAGEIYFARYDSPRKPTFLRRNEALIALAHPYK
jgi:hypothetical protein